MIRDKVEQNNPRLLIAKVTKTPVCAIPDVLCCDETAKAILSYAFRRFASYKEILTSDCWEHSLRFLADEPNPVAVIEQSLNDGGKLFRQFFPIPDSGYPRLHPSARFAMRTSRKLRSDKLNYVETVLIPRSRALEIDRENREFGKKMREKRKIQHVTSETSIDEATTLHTQCTTTNAQIDVFASVGA